MIKDALKLVLAFVAITQIPSVLFMLAMEAETSLYRGFYTGAAVAVMMATVIFLIDSYHEMN